MRFEFPFILIGKSTMAFLASQSWLVLKSWNTGGGLEQGFRRSFADRLKLSLVESLVWSRAVMSFIIPSGVG